eukprot:CAMPEP_0113644420 /NCGR_PEP_ID=MMETSP0017_2-20120614/23381_1 /TAXON_ID=2856 /ORGANISM="Cylindrotheca closterium" /LENGTH=684 /DNA_ID=CAMNT_0000556035 /DNA_START=259 /DNA_END=2310 /DNA_ORIENTATION=- /assembly_acc=CAM_ASM_000147
MAGDDDQLRSSRHSKKERAETEGESMDEDLEKPKKVKKKKKKSSKKDASAEGGAADSVKKKKKKKKKVVEAAAAAPEAPADNTEASAEATASPSSTDGADDGDGGAPLYTMPLKMPVRRPDVAAAVGAIDLSDAESEDTAKASGQSNKQHRSNSTGTYDKQTHVRFLEAQKRREAAQARLAANANSSSGGGSFSDDDDDDQSDHSVPLRQEHDRDSPPQPVPRSQRPVRTRRGANEARYKSNSLGALEKKKHQLVMRKKASIRIPASSRQRMLYMSSDDDDDGGNDSSGASSSSHASEEGEMMLGGPGGGGDDIPSRPVRSRGGSGQAKYRSASAGVLDKNVRDRFLQQRMSSDDDSDVGGRDDIPSRPVRSRGGGGSGQPQHRSTSTGVLDKNVRDRFLQKMSDDEGGRSSDGGGGTSDEGDLDGRPRRPQRVRRGSNQPRFRSNSAGALEKKKREIYNSRAPPNGANFLKPRKRSVGAIKAKETVQRSKEESSLHQAQPNIRVALPRLRSAGALNARGSGNTTSRRSGRDRSIPNKPLGGNLDDDDDDDDSDDPSDDDPSYASDDSPVDRKVQSERLLTSKWGPSDDDDDSSSDDSEESGAILVTSAPLPKSFRPSRNWADKSKQLDQLPTVARTSSAQSLPKKKPEAAAIAPSPASADTSVASETDVWMETLNDTSTITKK